MENKKASDKLIPGNIYSRADLREIFEIEDATINNGIFRPKGFGSVWLFVTKNKTSDRTQYDDNLVEDELRMQGQLQGRTDHLIVNHNALGLELLVFYRRTKNENPFGGFRYEGPFAYESHFGEKPTSFVLRRSSVDPIESDLEKEGVELSEKGDFLANDSLDARRRVVRSIVQRRGQPAFRKQLLAAYQGQCAITGCQVEAILEAAHIQPYLGDHTNVVSNGLLLRADIHTLFDLKLLWIDPDTLTVCLSPRLFNSEYADLHGRLLALPLKLEEHPSKAMLRDRLNAASLAL